MLKYSCFILPAMFLLLFVHRCNCKGDTIFDDGSKHVINWTIAGKTWVYNSFPENHPTSLTLQGGGRIENLYVHGDGHVQIYDGSLNYLEPRDSSIVELRGGVVDETVWAGEQSRVSALTGQIGEHLLGNGESEITLWGAIVSGNFGLSNSSRGYLFGGSIGGEIIVNERCQMTISGSDFMIDGNPVNYGIMTTGGQPYVEAVLTGTLLDGSPVNNTLIMTQDASVVFTPIPEPNALSVIVLGGLLGVRKWRRTVRVAL